MSEFTDKEKFEAILGMCEHHVERFRLRQAHEWKITFGFWALLITSLVYIRDELPFELKAVISLMAAGHILWLFLMNVRNYHELRRAYFYRDWAESILLPTDFDTSKRVPSWTEMSDEMKREIRREVIKAPFVALQVGVTIILVYLNIFSATAIASLLPNS